MTFKNLKDLFKKFPDEKTCVEYLIQQRWNGNIECPFCGATKVYTIEGGKRFKCADKFCNKKFSATVGTIYENNKVGLQTFFAALYLISSSKKGISSLQLSRQLGITQKSAWFVLHRIREMLKNKSTEVLSGTIEVDETYVGGKNFNRHKNKKHTGDTKIPVVGILDREKGVRTFAVPDTNFDRVRALIANNMDTKAELITDKHSNYLGLKNMGYNNHTIIKKNRHNYITDNYITDSYFHTNNIEGYWSLLKRGIIGIYHQVSPKHLQRYCDEFAARYNTRKIADNERFELSVKNSEGRLKYNELIGK
jgi:transposase-like protein